MIVWKKASVVALFITISFFTLSFAAQKTWDNSSAGNWSTGTWSGGTPGTDDTAIFDGSVNNNGCTLNANATITGIIFKNGYSGTFDFSNNTLTISGGVADFRSRGHLIIHHA